MASSLGLNEHHQSNVVNYIRFARYQRGQRLKCIEAVFSDLKDSRLRDETTFTIDEVEDMLFELQTDIRTEVEAELINTAHTNVLLLRQMFQQAEKWHLKLAADLSELENRDLLDQIREFEEREFAGASRDTDFKPKSMLAPINESGGAALLKIEIQRLQDEYSDLQQRFKQVESQALNLNQDKTRLMQEIDRLSGKGSAARIIASSGDSAALEQEMAQLRADLDSTRDMSNRTASELGNDLTGTKHELLKVRAMLEMAEKELEAKVSQTTPFKNLKAMLQKKNEQVRDLRRRLNKYEDE